MSQAPASKPGAWPDGTPRSQGNAFAVLYSPRHVNAADNSNAARKPHTSGKQLPFSLPGTRCRSR